MRLESLRTILALATTRDLDIIQFDITSAYLYDTLKEEVYMEQPKGYVAPGVLPRFERVGMIRLLDHVPV